MKRLLWIFIMVLPLCISGCSDDETQQITCAIQVPSDGETIQVRADEKLFIRGYGKADHGQIVSAELKVAGFGYIGCYYSAFLLWLFIAGRTDGRRVETGTDRMG